MTEEKNLTATLGDFVTLLVREISQSLALARYDAPLIRVNRVRVRFGEPQDSESFISKRYPFMADGWEVEMEMGSKIQPRLNQTPLPQLPAQTRLLDIFGHRPVHEIKGVNTDWGGFFRTHHIHTIAQLDALDMSAIKDLAALRPSVKLWETHGKAKLLRSLVPFFPATALDPENLYTLLKMEPEQFLARTRAVSVSITEIQNLVDVLEILVIVLDSQVLKSVPLKVLLSGPPVL